MGAGQKGLYENEGGDDVTWILDQMERSVSIYDLNVEASQGGLGGLESNELRENNMKTLFSENYEAAVRAGDAVPKVLIKLGQWHVLKGINWGRSYTLGNFVMELANFNGTQSFNMNISLINESGEYWSLTDYPDFDPISRAGDPNRWVVVDLRPLRPYIHAGRITGLASELERAIFGFDAVLLVGGGTRASFDLTTN